MAPSDQPEEPEFLARNGKSMSSKNTLLWSDYWTGSASFTVLEYLGTSLVNTLELSLANPGQGLGELASFWE